MSIWSDDDGRRHIGLSVDNQRIHRIMPKGTTQGDAKRLEAELKVSLQRHQHVRIPQDPPLTQLLAGYVEYARRSLRSPDTAEYHAQRAAPWAQKYRASEADVCAQHMVRDMRGKYAPATINRSLGVLKKALTIAWRERLIPENYGARITRLPENNQRDTYPTVEEVKRIASFCSKPAQAAIWVALLTGARRGEVCRIVPAKHVRGGILRIPASHTKTLKTKALPVTDDLREWLQYFPLPIGVDGVKSAFRRARIKAGLPGVHFHDMRHACASMLIEAGVDLYTVKNILGHSNVNTTTRYAHLQMDRKRDAMETLAGVIHDKDKKDGG